MKVLRGVWSSDHARLYSFIFFRGLLGWLRFGGATVSFPTDVFLGGSVLGAPPFHFFRCLLGWLRFGGATVSFLTDVFLGGSVLGVPPFHFLPQEAPLNSTFGVAWFRPADMLRHVKTQRLDVDWSSDSIRGADLTCSS